MTGDREESQRVLGIPLGAFSRYPDAEEPQRVLGFPVDWLASAYRDALRSLERPVRGCRRWLPARRRSQNGPPGDGPEPSG